MEHPLCFYDHLVPEPSMVEGLIKPGGSKGKTCPLLTQSNNESDHKQKFAILFHGKIQCQGKDKDQAWLGPNH